MQLAAARSDAPFPKPLRESSGHRVLGDDPWVVEAARRGGRYGIKAYTAREWDPEINLYYYRARYYDPRVGRFISEDPIGMFGGINLYLYVDDCPTTLRDPSGLQVGRPPRPMEMTCWQAASNVWVLFRQVKEDKVPDKVGHCLAHCWLTKACGAAASHMIDKPKEAWDAAKGMMAQIRWAGVRVIPFDPNNRWQQGDIDANARGRNCAREMSCTETCWDAQTRFGPDR
jgi:RHS repeat-associated protein